MVSHGVYMAGLFLLVGMLYERRQSYEMADFGGWAKTTPVLATLFLILMATALGFPGLAGFVGEILILVSVYKANPGFGFDFGGGVCVVRLVFLLPLRKSFPGLGE